MKKIYMLIILFTIGINMQAQTTLQKMSIWAGNEICYQQTTNQIDSITFAELPYRPVGSLSGSFSVSATSQIRFAQGNLQYQASSDTWRFAEHQYDMIGCENTYISYTYSGWIDLFGWGTGSNPTKTDSQDADYTPFTDWGINVISNGSNIGNQWRTLTRDEWIYLFFNRPNADQLFGFGMVSGTKGLIILPDEWATPTGTTFVHPQALNRYGNTYRNNYGDDNYARNIYTAEQWNVLEAAGAVFLPITGRRDGTDIYMTNPNGYYWTATSFYNWDAYYLGFSSNYVGPEDYYSKHWGYSVRLVQAYERADAASQTTRYEMRTWVGGAIVFQKDVERIDSITFKDIPAAQEGTINGLFSVSATQQVQFSRGNLQYRASSATWRFAEQQYEILGESNANIGNTYSGWIDLFGWGTGNNPTKTSGESNTFTDWGVNVISNGGNTENQWRTMTKDEWGYLFFSRTNASTLFGLGTVSGVSGLIILPDEWVTPEGVSFVASTTMGLTDQGNNSYRNNNSNNFSHNTYTADQWRIMEEQGAVFLPAGGTRVGCSVAMNTVGLYGNYYSATEQSPGHAYYMHFNKSYLEPMVYTISSEARSVRLVRNYNNE